MENTITANNISVVDSTSVVDATLAVNRAAVVIPHTRRAASRRGKKRSARACASCRTRKVRCDIVAHGAPCSNCRHDEVECILPISRRQRAARERALQQALEHAESLKDSVRNGGKTDDESSQQTYEDGHPSISREHTPLRAPHGMDISEHPLAEILPTNSISQCHSPSRAYIPSNTGFTVPQVKIRAPLATAINVSTETYPSSTDSPTSHLPKVFAPFSPQLDAAEISYLHGRDALTIPRECFQIALLKSFAEFVYPVMPILDLEEFVSVVTENSNSPDGPQKQIGLLLFQAVMFAGIETVDIDILREEGFGGRESAKRELWARCKLLYDFDTTTDRHTIIQSLLLMSLYTPPSTILNDYKDSHHYLGLAISLSISLGINRDLPSLPMEVFIKRKKVERRMWWCAFLRDRILTMEARERGLERVPRIRREDCDIGMLSLEDFGLLHDGNSSYPIEIIKAKLNAESIIEKVRLCWWQSSADHLARVSGICHPLSDPLLLGDQQLLDFREDIEFCQDPQTEMQDLSSPASFLEFQHPDCSHSSPLEEGNSQYEQTSSVLLGSPSTPHSSSTPQDEVFTSIEEGYAEIAEGGIGQVVTSVHSLDAGHGVEGEYDDYLEYLNGSMDVAGEGKIIEVTRARVLDYEAKSVLEMYSSVS